MTKRHIRVHPELLDELKAALDYYRTIDPALPERFLSAYAARLGSISQHPLAAREYMPGFRRLVLAPFPYMIAFTVDDESVSVLALLHVLRDPRANRQVVQQRN